MYHPTLNISLVLHCSGSHPRILHKIYRTWSLPILEASSYCSFLFFSVLASSHTATLLIPQMHQAPFQFIVMFSSASFACKTDSYATASQSFHLRHASSFFSSQLNQYFREVFCDHLRWDYL